MTDDERKLRNREACRRWREKNKDYDRERQKRYWAMNPEKRREKNQRWRTRDPERALLLGRKSYHKNKNNDRPCNKAEYKLWWNAKKRANKSGILFNLERDDVVIPELCPIFGVKLEVGHPRNAPSLDKVIPELGYVKGNVAVISRAANTIKSYGTAEEHRKIADFMDRFSSL